MSDWYNSIYYTYFPIEYARHTIEQLYDVLCISCGQRFGDHLNDKCPYSHRINGKKFVAPRITTQKGNKPIC